MIFPHFFLLFFQPVGESWMGARDDNDDDDYDDDDDKSYNLKLSSLKQL